MLKVDNINLFYGAAQALRGVSIAAEPGKVTCVLGRNGVGKTSLLRAMVGQYPIASGSIIFDGTDISGLKPYERARRGIGFVPQGREIFPLLTVEENLKTGFGPLKREDRNIPDDVFSLFPVLNTMLGRRGGDLSGGQQQQLAIGRALVMRPKLLLLDEPTEGIQPSIIKDIGRAISYLRSLGNIAIVLVEQYLDFACELGDNFAVMDRGAVKYRLRPQQSRSRRNQPPDGALVQGIMTRSARTARLGSVCATMLTDTTSAASLIFAANRARGAVAFDVHLADGVTRRRHLHESGSLRVRFPSPEADGLSAVFVNTAGGVAGGDRFDIDIAAGEGARLTLTTAAAEKIYRAESNPAAAEYLAARPRPARISAGCRRKPSCSIAPGYRAGSISIWRRALRCCCAKSWCSVAPRWASGC